MLDIARLHGETPVVEQLIKYGAKGTVLSPPALKPRRENTIQSAIQSSLPLIQRADANFVPKAACVSCHNNSFAAMAVGMARKSGFQVDEKTAAQQVKANVFGLEKLRDYLHQGFFAPVGDVFGQFVVSYILIGLDAEHYKPDLNTDAVAMYLKSHQSPDGQWVYPAADVRPGLWRRNAPYFFSGAGAAAAAGAAPGAPVGGGGAAAAASAAAAACAAASAACFISSA